jgi:DNA repair exonuclease SbcCD ATPase subunit
MFDSIIQKVPELQRLEETVADLQQQQAAAQAKAAALANRVAQAREDDLNREALALNRGGKAPKPKEPELRSQLERAQRELEVLERRLALAGSDRSRYIQEHHEELTRLLMEAQKAEGEKVAGGAATVLEDLLRYFKAEDDLRALRRLVPAAAPENTGAPQKSVTVWGNVTTQNFGGGPARGDLEGTLRYLASLGSTATTVVGEDAEGAA